MKKINQISTKQSNKNSYYRIAVKYDCPYIAQRNGGNREVDSHLSLKCAQQRLLEMFNVYRLNAVFKNFCEEKFVNLQLNY